VSICSVIEMKSTPRCRNSSSASINCFVDRAKRSNFQTSTVSILRARAACHNFDSSGLSLVAPLTVINELMRNGEGAKLRVRA
jgi:hypothetical protein